MTAQHKIIVMIFSVILLFNSQANDALAEEKNNVVDKKTVVPILIYHHLDDDYRDNHGAVISPKRFREHLVMLQQQGYTTIGIHDLLAFIKKEKPLPKKPIMITFDDGYKSNYTYAFPLLKEFNMKATIFVVTYAIEQSSMQSSSNRLNWKEAKEMYDYGLIDIQSHTHGMHYRTHTINGFKATALAPNKLKNRTETVEEYEKRVAGDLVWSKHLIENKVGAKVISICYPYGEHSEKLQGIAKQTGFELGLAANEGVNKQTTNPYELKRIPVSGLYTAKILNNVINKYR